ncbi:MAG: hypothetical protein ABMB14_23305 [Myxococcota bacterium]
MTPAIALAAWIAAGWAPSARATTGFDPLAAPEARLEGRETWTQIEDVRLWNAIERWDDPDRALFHLEAFNDGTAWRDADPSPWIATAFGTPTPPSSKFLLHIGIHEPTATGTPILMVPGAGDNGSRAYVTLATHFDQLNRPVYAMTFGHPHGDVFMQAELVADAIAVIRARTGADQVDVVAHSKGGIAAAVYAASGEVPALGDAVYADVGTRYRGDVRRMVFVATPLGGVDTSYRWPGLNLYGLDPDATLNPTSWDRYYPDGTAFPTVFDDLADQDLLPDGRDLFPGQRQLLRRQDAPLPGSSAWLGVYALQPDWYSTVEGGLGFLSRSDGIEAAIASGGGLIDVLATVGLDPGIGVYQVAGTNPLLPNGDTDLTAQFDLLGELVDYADLIDAIDAHGTPLAADADELAALERGDLVLGEITGRSDGLVFLASATDDRAITARGGAVADAYVVDLSHLDLLYASPITGQLLIDSADAGGPADQWMRPLGARYAAADTIGWIERALADPPSTTPGTGDTGGTPTTTATAPTGGGGGAGSPYAGPCGSCAIGGPAGGPGPGIPGALAIGWIAGRRRIRRQGARHR